MSEILVKTFESSRILSYRKSQDVDQLLGIEILNGRRLGFLPIYK